MNSRSLLWLNYKNGCFYGTPRALEIVGIDVQKYEKVGLGLCQEAQSMAVPYSLAHQEANVYLTATATPSFPSPRSFLLLFRMKWCHCCLVARTHGSKPSGWCYPPPRCHGICMCCSPLSNLLLPHRHHQHWFVLFTFMGFKAEVPPCCRGASCEAKQNEYSPRAFKQHVLSTEMCLLGISS